MRKSGKSIKQKVTVGFSICWCHFKGTLKNQASNFQIERNDLIYSSKDAESKIEENYPQ